MSTQCLSLMCTHHMPLISEEHANKTHLVIGYFVVTRRQLSKFFNLVSYVLVT